MSEAILLSYNNSEEVEKDVKALLEASAIEYEVKSMDEVGLPTFKVARDDGKNGNIPWSHPN